MNFNFESELIFCAINQTENATAVEVTPLLRKLTQQTLRINPSQPRLQYPVNATSSQFDYSIRLSKKRVCRSSCQS